MSARSSVFGALALALSAGCVSATVVRSAGGDTYVGRFVSARAYEAYARGALLEAEGRTDAAVRSFREAADLDTDGPEAWVRLGSLLCLKSAAEADDAFASAEAADPAFAPLHREHARCHLARNELALALRESELAMILDPDDSDAGLIHIDALLASGAVEQADRELVARTLVNHPPSSLVDRLKARGRASKSAALTHLARALERPDPKLALQERQRPSLEDVDAALAQGDLRRARRLALRAHLSQGDLAIRAAALGLFALAREQASLVLGAEPGDTASRVALLVASDATTPAEAAAAQDGLAADRGRALSRLERLLLAEKVAKTVGPDAARAVLGDAAINGAHPGSDKAEATVVARLSSWVDGRARSGVNGAIKK